MPVATEAVVPPAIPDTECPSCLSALAVNAPLTIVPAAPSPLIGATSLAVAPVSWPAFANASCVAPTEPTAVPRFRALFACAWLAGEGALLCGEEEGDVELDDFSNIPE